MCTDYFQAYRDCKKKWIDERRAEKWKNAFAFGKKTEEEQAEEAQKAHTVAEAIEHNHPEHSHPNK